nr:MAG TPA: hypothetical protein [Caudoviricetes sp.]
MRMLNRNKQRMKYYVNGKKVPIYDTDDDGNIKYIIVDGERVPVETGEYQIVDEKLVDFKANINSTLTEAFIKAFGVDDSSDKATIVCAKNKLPLKVGMRIWRNSEVGYSEDGSIDIDSADYVVAAANDEALNEDSFLLKKVAK